MMRRQIAGVSLLAGLFVLLSSVSSRAADDDSVSFKKRGDEEKRFVTRVGEAILKAAHPTGRKRALVKYEITMPKTNRTELAIKMEYYGLVSSKKYVADIVVIIDSTNKDSWEVLNIKYSDSNPSITNPNERKIQELIKELNK